MRDIEDARKAVRPDPDGESEQPPSVDVALALLVDESSEESEEE